MDNYFMIKSGYILKLNSSETLEKLPEDVRQLFYNTDNPHILTKDEARYREKVFRDQVVELTELLEIISHPPNTRRERIFEI